MRADARIVPDERSPANGCVGLMAAIVERVGGYQHGQRRAPWRLSSNLMVMGWQLVSPWRVPLIAGPSPIKVLDS